MSNMIKTGLGSHAEIKIGGLEEASDYCRALFDIIPIKVESDVSQQPYGHSEGLRGCMLRMINAQVAYPHCEIYAAAENYIYYDANNNGYFDRAACGLWYIKTNTFYYDFSDSVQFDTDSVIETMDKPHGFLLHTVGKTMMQKGLVKNHADPHFDLVGKHRQEFIKETFIKVIAKAQGVV